MSGFNNVSSPRHYTDCGIESIDAIRASMTHEAFAGYLKGNIIKYMWRYEQKGYIEDVAKAQEYIKRLHTELSEFNDQTYERIHSNGV